MDPILGAIAFSHLDFRLENLVKNGNFSQGGSGWRNYNGTIEEYKGKQCFKQTQRNHRYFQTVPMAKGDMLYYGCYMAQEPTGFTDFYTSMGLTRGLSLNAQERVTLSSDQRDGEFHLVSGAKRVDDEDSILLGFWSTSDTVATTYYTDVFVFNLTKSFGNGNEPTKEEMDVLFMLLGGWFDGTVQPSQSILLSWQLKLMRQNREAILALGGTFV
jgi:hypothetical protein